MRPLRPALAGLCALLLSQSSAWADEPLQGQFRAGRSCDALVSIRKSTNPDHVITGPGISYKLLARNRKKATHYRIEVPGAVPPERWVDARCGQVTITQDDSRQAPPPVTEYVLALSWQPAFCETAQKKPECQFQTGNAFDANYFSLHGLWPQPSTKAYCNVSPALRTASESGKWKDLPEIELGMSTRADLETVMPGARSFLERHEWTKHGTCYPADGPEPYFRDALRLTKEVNESELPNLMMERRGKTVTADEIRARFEQAFGEGAGERVKISCKDDGKRRLISEITIGLKGDIPGGAPLAELMLASNPTDPGCPGGVVDPVGQQ